MGSHVVDFYCPGERLVIELDGASHDDPLYSEYDAERQAYLEAKAIRGICLDNKQAFEDEDEVLAYIENQFYD